MEERETSMQVGLGLNLGTRSPESRIIDRDQARRKEYIEWNFVTFLNFQLEE